MSSRALRPLTVLAVLILATIPIGAGTISLSWDPVSHPNLAGYRVFYGTTAGNLNDFVDVDTLSATVSGLDDCTNYFLAVKARGNDDSLSPTFSNQISGWARPVLTSDNLTSVQAGTSAQLVLSGANFMPNAGLTFSNPGISVDSISVSCTQITADISVGAGASTGNVDVEVTNPDNVFGAASNMFSVVGDTAPPVVSSLSTGQTGGTSTTVTWQTDEPADGQVFHREQGSSGWIASAVDSQLSTSHDFTLNGLVPETTYEYYVASSDAAGNAADTSASPGTFTTTESSFSYLRFEAEAGDLTSDFTTATHALAFEGDYVKLPNGASQGSTSNPTGTATFGFNTPQSGAWTVWVRMWAQTPGNDQWMEEVDGGGFQLFQAQSEDDWEWIETRTYQLAAGLHSFRLGGYEEKVRVDRVLITDDPGFVPTEVTGGDTVEPGSPAGLQTVPGDTANNLQWTNPGDSDVTRYVVRYRTDGNYPVSPVDGFPADDQAASPSAAESLVHSGLTNGTTYSYSVFILDAAGNVSDRSTAEGTPEAPAEPLGTVQNVQRNDTQE